MRRLLYIIIFAISLIINKYIHTMEMFLTNGTKESRVLVGRTLSQLQKLYEKEEDYNRIPLLSLIALCRHEGYNAADSVKPILQKFRLVDHKGSLLIPVKNVVQSAISVDPYEITYRLITQNGTTPSRSWLEVEDNNNNQIILQSPIRRKQ